MQKNLFIAIIYFLIPFYSINQSLIPFDRTTDCIQLSPVLSSPDNSDITLKSKVLIIGNDNLVNAKELESS